ncbi:PAS domain-containing protein [Streptomyces sp. AD681]|uniref:PAS domain-containing protein n=1 Tax=Streptomyces sp. AD681 TaxID=3019069 RepID=UPI003FA75821
MNARDAADGGSPSQVASALVDRRGAVVGWSHAAERLVQRPAAEILRRSVLRLLADPDAVTAGGLPDSGTARLRCGSGKIVTVCYRVEGLRNPSLSLILAVAADQASEAEWDSALSRALLPPGASGSLLSCQRLLRRDGGGPRSSLHAHDLWGWSGSHRCPTTPYDPPDLARRFPTQRH